MVDIHPNRFPRGEKCEITLTDLPEGFSQYSQFSLSHIHIMSVQRYSQEVVLSCGIPANTPVGWKELTISNAEGRKHKETYGVFVSATESSREALLLKAFDQAWKNIDSHTALIWQSVSVLASTIALMTLVAKDLLSFNYAVTLIVGVAAWLAAHVLDAWTWFHRNLVLLVNVERQFLNPEDQRLILPYFAYASHRDPQKMTEQFKIQLCFAFGWGIVALLFHFAREVTPSFDCRAKPDLAKAIPYLVALATLILVKRMHDHSVELNREINQSAPGLPQKPSKEKSGPAHPTE